MSNPNEIISLSKSLKDKQSVFITDNKRKFKNEGYVAPELYDTPTTWIEEYVAYGGTLEVPSTMTSRIQQLIELTREDSDFLEIRRIINSTNNENIIWNIEEYYKSKNNNWDAFIFSIIITLLAKEVPDNISVKKWINKHSDGWMKSYTAP